MEIGKSFEFETGLDKKRNSQNLSYVLVKII